MGKPVRVGIIGAGFAAHFHLASYRKVYGESFEIAAICSRNAGPVRALADSYGIARRFDSVEAMLRDSDLDAIDLCVPNHLHVPLIIEAAAHGKHIICEKPLGGYFGPPAADEGWSARGASRQNMLESIVEQVSAVRTAIDRAGVTFCYGENWVYAPPIAKVDRLLAASGSTIMRIEAEESHSGSHSRYALRWRTAGGGSLLRLCVHPIGAALHLKYQEGRRRAGKPIRPVTVLAQVANLTYIESFRNEPRKHVTVGWEDVEDWASIIITFEDGSIAQLTSTDTRLGGIRNYLTAHGSRAVASANINPNTMCQAFTPDGSYFDDEYIVEKTQTKEGWSFPAADEDAVTGYPEELRDFIGAIAQGRPPKSDLMLASDVLLAVYAGYLSAERGTPVNLSAWR
jgi:predicted dehydrogenase